MKLVIFGSNQKNAKLNKISLQINGYQVDAEDSFKYLGVVHVMHKNMSWLDHIDQLNVKVCVCQRLGALRRVQTAASS